MGIIQTIKRWVSMLFVGTAKEQFDIKPVSATMDRLVREWTAIYQGRPYWLDPDDDIDTINAAQLFCSETARLATLAIGIKIEGSARADYLQQQIENVYFKLREWVEYGCAYGTIILKPNGSSIDLVTPGNFIVTEQNNGSITGVVFINQLRNNNGKTYWTRLEYHRFLDDGRYAITNRVFKGESKDDIEQIVPIELSPWSHLQEEMVIANIDKPLYAVFRTPHANNIEIDSPLGMAIFSEATKELRDLDVAYSRKSVEIDESRRTVMIDSDRLMTSGQALNNGSSLQDRVARFKLPKYVRAVMSSGDQPFYQEINPQLNTQTRQEGINALLSQIGYKIGYSGGYFSFDEKTGMITATQVEADDRRTIQFIKDVRDKLECTLDALLYALNVFADLYSLAPLGKYEAVYDFGDITYNVEEDRARWWKYVQAGKVPAWKYFVKFEGMTEEEAKQLEAEAQPKTERLFEEE